MTEPAGTGMPASPAFLRVGGAALARHQLGLVLAMDCQRIICLARAVTPDLIALQHEAEAAGARFHIVSGAHGMAGLITANDDLLALAEGLLVDPEDAGALLDPGHTVLVQPVEAGLAAGFERLDMNHAAAGALRLPGRLIERLMELPADCDVLSALTRIALQAGVPMREIPVVVRQGARWQLIRDEGEAHAAEGSWMRRQIGEQRMPTPVVLLSRLGLLGLGPSLLHAGSASKVAMASALAVLLLGLGAGWFGFIATGFVFVALAAVLRETVASLSRIERAALSRAAPSLSARNILGWLLDLAVVVLVVWSVPIFPRGPLAEPVFAPLLLVILLRLTARIFDGWRAAWIKDRSVLAVLLALAALAGFLFEAVQLLAVLLAAGGLLIPGGKARLTRA